MSFCITDFNAVNNPVVSDTCFATATRNLTINKGTTFGLSFVLSKDGDLADLSGYTVRSAIKASYDSADDLVYMSTSNQMITVQLDTSEVVMNIPEKVTRRIPGALGVYDIELISSTGQTAQIIKGTVTFNDQVTT